MFGVPDEPVLLNADDLLGVKVHPFIAGIHPHLAELMKKDAQRRAPLRHAGFLREFTDNVGERAKIRRLVDISPPSAAHMFHGVTRIAVKFSHRSEMNKENDQDGEREQ